MKTYGLDIGTPATQAVVKAARALVQSRRWYMDLPPDRPLPDAMQNALDRALQALDAEEADRG